MVFLIYFFAINIITLILFGIDKWKAVHGKWRISEAALLALACIGGSLGALFGMLIFRHKIRKAKFTVGIPVIMAAQIAVYILIRGHQLV